MIIFQAINILVTLLAIFIVVISIIFVISHTLMALQMKKVINILYNQIEMYIDIVVTNDVKEKINYYSEFIYTTLKLIYSKDILYAKSQKELEKEVEKYILQLKHQLRTNLISKEIEVLRIEKFNKDFLIKKYFGIEYSFNTVVSTLLKHMKIMYLSQIDSHNYIENISSIYHSIENGFNHIVDDITSYNNKIKEIVNKGNVYEV